MESEGKDFQMPPTLLYKLINNLDKMKEESYKASRQSAYGLRGNTFPSSPSHQRSILLDKIKDQQIYLCVTNALLRMAKEAGAPEDALQQVSQSLLAARGYQSSKMLVDANQPQESLKKRRESYNWLDRGLPVAEEQALLARLDKQLVQARETQSHYKCLVKYKSQKEDQIAPIAGSTPNSRKERFKRMMKERIGVHTVQSSNFYQFQANQILKNSFRQENQCFKTMCSFSHLKSMFGHATESDMQTYSQIFNAILDRTDNLIITGGEQGLIKIWHKDSGTLIANLKGHTDFLNKIQTSKSNKYLFTAGGDGLRFFDLRSFKPLSGWRTTSIQEISSFIHKDKELFLFGDNSTLYILTEEMMLSKGQERLDVKDFYRFSYGEVAGGDNSPILVISLSPQDTFLLLGLQSGKMLGVLVFDLLEAMKMNKVGQQLTLPCIIDTKAHAEQIIEIKWSDNYNMWATGGKDGRCCLWQLKNDEPQMITVLGLNNKSNKGRKRKSNYTCSYICWNCTYSHFAAGFQQNVEDEDNDRGHGEVLVYSLKDRKVSSELSKVSKTYGGIRAMDAHPYYPNILLICEAEGNILLFDIFVGVIIHLFQQRGYHILHPNFHLIPTECHFSQTGLSFIVANEYGSVSIYGYDSKIFYNMVPTEQFFKTDFEQVDIQQETMRAIPLMLPFQRDINDYPRGDIVNVRGQKHINAIQYDPQKLMQLMSNRSPNYKHFPEIELDYNFLRIVLNNIKQNENQEQKYSRIYEQVEKARQTNAFYEYERLYNGVQNMVNQKLSQIKSIRQENLLNQGDKSVVNLEEQEPYKKKRKLRRHAQNSRINYADDFQYQDSQQEEYDGAQDFIEQEPPEELGESFDENEDQQQAPRIRRRPENRRNRRITRLTRQSNNPSRGLIDDPPDIVSQQRITRKRRRDLMEVLDSFESENQPKKKYKADQQQDSSEEKPLSRLKKQSNEISNEIVQDQLKECYRCQLIQPSQFCHNCSYHQQYCQACSQFRGLKIKDKYQCLICIYIKNRAEEERQNVSQQLYRITQKSQQLYVPQINDKVRYFFQGYEQFLVQNIYKLSTHVFKNNQSFRLLPHTQDSYLTNTPLCQVVSIEYFFPMKYQNSFNVKRTPGKTQKSHILMLIGLKPLPSGEIFWIFYLPGHQYLVLQQIYAQIDQKSLLSKLLVNQLITLKDQELQIVQVGPFEDRFPESIWKMVKIRKTQGKRLRGNTKEIQRRVNVWKLSQDVQNLFFENDLQPKQVQRLAEQLKIWKDQTDSYYCIFQEYVQFEIYPKYRQEIAVGMCLETILSRLQKNYYSSRDSLQQDIRMIYQNSLKFNGPSTSHQVTKKAEQLINSLFNLLNNDQAPIPSNSKGTQQDSANKKEKIIKQSEQLLQSFSNQFQTRRKTRREEQKAIRRKKDSSEYQQDEPSIDPNSQFGRGVSTRNTRHRNKEPKQQNEAKRVTRSTNRH